MVKLNISCINVNSFNVSTIRGKNSKTFLKIEGITGKKADIILISDCRAGKYGQELERMFNMSINGRYKLYINSTKERRGVAIAVKGEIFHEILATHKDEEENYLILKLRIQNTVINIGAIYGPNENNVAFYNRLKQIWDIENELTILGGDFNTVQDTRGGIESIDRIGNGECPNITNARVINEWIYSGKIVDPYRVLYPETREYSYTSFRRGDTLGRNRLDFFLISSALIMQVDNTKYEDRLGRDFDHREVIMSLGKKGGKRKEYIYKSTLDSDRAKYAGLIAFYDTTNEHALTPCEQVRLLVGQLEVAVRQLERIKLGLETRDINGGQLQ